MRANDLSIFVLEKIAQSPMKNAFRPPSQRGGMPACWQTLSSGLDSYHFHGVVLVEGMKEADRIRAARHTGEEIMGKPAFFWKYLFTSFPANHRLEISDDHRKGMRTHHGAHNVMSRLDICHPVTHGFINGVLQRPCACLDGNHPGAEALHPEYIRGLTNDIFFSHVHIARH